MVLYATRNKKPLSKGRVKSDLKAHAKWLESASGGKKLDWSHERIVGYRFDPCTFMDYACITGACFQDCNMSRVQMRMLEASHVEFHTCDLSSADFMRAQLESAKFTNSNLNNAYFYGCLLQMSEFPGSDLERAYLGQCQLQDHGFLHVDMKENRGYMLYAIEASEPRFIAGCRNFTYRQAMIHWGPENGLKKQPQYIKAIDKYMKERET